MKFKTAILTAALTTALFSGTVYAARSFGVSDAVKLQRSLHSMQGGSADYDLDGSGEVDVFDLGLLKRMLLGKTS